MKYLQWALALGIVSAGPALSKEETENKMHQALKKVGPSYLCGATHQYRDAIEGLRMSMLEAGVPDTLAKLSVNALDAYIKKEHGEKRATITADECKNIYKMP